MPLNFTRTLKWGMSGNDVDDLHGILSDVFAYWKDKTKVPSGKLFTYETKAAVQNFQRRQAKPATGEVDRATWDTLMFCHQQAILAWGGYKTWGT